MKLLSLSMLLFITGCQTIPALPKLPDLPIELSAPCPELKTLEGTTVLLSKLMDTVAANYTTYHSCASRHVEMVDWYNKQKDIINKIAK